MTPSIALVNTLQNVVNISRDMGTVVFPDAQLKIFLGASADARAQRRHKQLSQAGILDSNRS